MFSLVSLFLRKQWEDLSIIALHFLGLQKAHSYLTINWILPWIKDKYPNRKHINPFGCSREQDELQVSSVMVHPWKSRRDYIGALSCNLFEISVMSPGFEPAHYINVLNPGRNRQQQPAERSQRNLKSKNSSVIGCDLIQCRNITSKST